jgi:hypothetical protein
MITIQIDSAHHHTLDGRVADMIVMLVEMESDIASTDKVQVVFDCAGSCVNAKVTKTHQRTGKRRELREGR